MNPAQPHLTDIFLETGRKFSHKTAIIHGNKQITFGELELDVRKTAAYMRRRGIQPGHKVLVLLPMSIDLYRMIMAINFLGAIAVLLDEWVSVGRMEECCRISKPDAYVILKKGKILGLLSRELRSIPVALSVTFPYDEIPLEQHVQVPSSTPSLITFTTGSTGTPKAVVRSFQFLYNQLEALKKEINPEGWQTDLVTLPVLLFMNLSLGATSIIADFDRNHPDRLDPARILRDLETHQAFRIIASPAFVVELSRYLLDHPGTLEHLRAIYLGGAPVFPAEANTIKAAFPDAKATVLYGSTEAEPISSVSADRLAYSDPSTDGGLLVGTLHPDISVRIVPITGDIIELEEQQELTSLACKTGEIGEIVVSGGHVSTVYGNSALWPRHKIREGDIIWHRTGDAGFLDRQNSLFLTGRCDSMISREGAYISPFLFRNYLQQLPNVVTGTILEVNKELTAVVQVSSQSHENDVRNMLSQLDIPLDAIRFVKRIPMDPRHNGKIDDAKLRSIL